VGSPSPTLTKRLKLLPGQIHQGGSMRIRSIVKLSIGAIALLCGLGMGGSLLPEAQAAISCGQTLGPGGTFVLTQDLMTCNTNPVLTVNGASLDLGGHTVMCTSTERNGIELIGQGGRLKNGKVTGCANGVVLAGIGKHVVQSMVVDGNVAHGFRLTSPNNTLESSTTQLNGGDGVHITTATNRLNNNTALWNTQDGFDINSGAGQNQLLGNVASYNGKRGFQIATDKNRLSNNTAGWNLQSGFNLVGNNNILSLNASHDNTKKGIDVQANNNQLTSNIVTHNLTDGIRIEPITTGNLVKSNDVEANGLRGIIISSGATKNSITKNISLGHATEPDLEDDNSACGSDTWSSNIFVSKLPDCIH
jgi:hypothetical protein